MKESRFVKTKIAAGYLILIAVCILSVGYVYRTVVRYSAPDGSYALLQSKRRAVNEVLYHLYQAESYGQLMIAGYQSCEALYRRELRAVRGCIDSLRRVADSGTVRALSFPGWWYATIRRHLRRSIDLLTWKHRTTQFEFFLTSEGWRMLRDPQLKVILVKDKGHYHR